MTARPLSRAQIDALRRAEQGHLRIDGRPRRTLLWLVDHGLITWRSIHPGHAEITSLGRQRLAAVPRRKLDPPGTLRITDVGDRRVITLVGRHEDKS